MQNAVIVNSMESIFGHGGGSHWIPAIISNVAKWAVYDGQPLDYQCRNARPETRDQGYGKERFHGCDLFPSR